MTTNYAKGTRVRRNGREATVVEFYGATAPSRVPTMWIRYDERARGDLGLDRTVTATGWHVIGTPAFCAEEDCRELLTESGECPRCDGGAIPTVTYCADHEYTDWICKECGE